MACPRCAPLLEGETDDRERSELDDGFEILSETVDKYDSCTMWWYGKARCRACGQRAGFEYMSGSQSSGRLTPEP
jgi:hypothetical protein